MSSLALHQPAEATIAGRTTFYTSGVEHSPTSATATGWEPMPWHATQWAAWEVLKRPETS
jgi:hypothetical protein